MNRAIRVFDKALVVWCQAITAALALAVVLTVFLRYVLGITFVWAEEVITMLFVATTFFGAALGVKENEHINIPVLVDALPAKSRRFMRIVGLVISIAVLFVLFLKSLNWIEKSGSMVTPGLRVPERIFYYMVPAGAVLMAFYCVRRIVAIVLAQQERDTEEE